MRKKIIAGNWKMNLNRIDAELLVNELIQKVPKNNTEIILSPSYIHLSNISDIVKNNDNIYIAAQDCSQNAFGAFTGEVSASMISSYNISYLILGHSERRANFNESHKVLVQKVSNALKNKLKVIFCCGESLNDRNNNLHFKVIEQQLENTIFKFSSEDLSTFLIAYEPVWAIGTGITANVNQAQEMHKFIRDLISAKFSSSISENISILYGGSCNSSNAKDLFASNDIDGGLIGGASLKSDEFIKIINSF